ncbi:MAG TPA: glycosyltransferase family 39 protein [Bryobacteraceae bacterium]|nr:glycosyltransferase family 39 protein [Bryobacteraceae bacterium]
MENSDDTGFGSALAGIRERRRIYLIVLLFAAAVFLAAIVSPPSLMDDVDAVQAQIARNMISSGDWVTAHIDGLAYLEKSPLIYWLIAISYKIFGFSDWAARIPVALSSIGLAWLTAAFGVWAFGRKAGLYAGLSIATCIGLFLFTRVLIPDVMLTFTIALAMWAFLRVLDEQELHPRLWAGLLWAGFGVGLLLKSTVAVLFPAAAAAVYLLLTGQLFSRKVWNRLHVWSGLAIMLLIAAPWHVLAALRNPPLFDFTMRSLPGEYHGFVWFYFINEQVLRFLNLRYPRDYNTVPRVWFWLFHFAWLFPWSVYFPAVFRLSFRPVDRAGRTRLLALCWTGFLLVFFSFSTTQEYYSMPCYPALALLLGSAMAAGGAWVRWGTRVLVAITGCAALAVAAILFTVRNLPTPGDISAALAQHPGAYTLSLGHMEDLTIDSFAYLRLPLALAGVAFLIGALGSLRANGQRAFLASACMMVLFFFAARVAMVAFDPYLSSRPLAEALRRAPEGDLVVDHHYYTFSSIFFYTNRRAWLLNGRINNLVYGSYAPGAPDVFLTDEQWREHWLAPRRCYVVAKTAERARFARLVGASSLFTVAESGGKMVLTNQPLGAGESSRSAP